MRKTARRKAMLRSSGMEGKMVRDMYIYVWKCIGYDVPSCGWKKMAVGDARI